MLALITIALLGCACYVLGELWTSAEARAEIYRNAAVRRLALLVELVGADRELQRLIIEGHELRRLLAACVPTSEVADEVRAKLGRAN